MSKFKAIETPIEGLFIIEPTDHNGNHNDLVEADLKQDLQDIGIYADFVQDNSIKMARGVLKGLHFQREQAQGMLVRAISGAALDIAVDLRPESYTYGASWSAELTAENQRMFWIPEQFAHGLLTLEANTEIAFKYTDFENKKSLAGIIWNDPIVCIDWQFERYDIDVKYLNMSDRDKRLPVFRSWDPKTLWK